MMRSTAASMDASSSPSDIFESFEFGDGIVGKLELAYLAALKHLDDDAKQSLFGDQIVRDCAGTAQIIRGDGVGIAHHPHIHHSHAALDQHDPIPLLRGDKR